MRYKFLEHTADVKFQAFGKTLEEAFSNSSLALVNAMCKEKIKGSIKKRIRVSGKDLESLLYNLLEELLFLLDTKNFVLEKILKIKITKKTKQKFELEAEALGGNAREYSFDLDVKAVTYSQMFVKKQGGKFICQVVLDV